MGKDKLKRFAENLTFRCMVQAEFSDIFNKDYKLKGCWGRDFFGNENPIVLELGCGRGEYTIDLARKYGDKNFIGIDIKGARMWRGAKTATEEGLPNVGFVRSRIEFIGSFFAACEISEIWITFPDPHLKPTQDHRRLTSPDFLSRYAQFLTPGGVIHLKTDSLHLHQYTKWVLKCNNIEAAESISDIYSGEPIPELLTIQTTYEKRFIGQGLPITYLRFSLGSGVEFVAERFWGDQQSPDLDATRRRKVRIEIDPRSGFCFGVVRAIEAAETFLSDSRQGFSLGEIVHNRVEVERLQGKGLQLISHSDLESLPSGSTVLVRAHGEPPSTFAILERRGINIVNATCPVVSSLQRRVSKAWDKMQAVNGQVIILGKRGHSEVVGLTGQVGGDAIVVESVSDLDLIDFSRPITMLSQTTQSLELFGSIKREILLRCSDESNVTIHDTICRQVAGRNPHLKTFAKRFDLILFVSSRHSSNGKALFDVCQSANANSRFIEREDEIGGNWFVGVNSVGICGATSTPLWLMQKISKKISQMINNQNI